MDGEEDQTAKRLLVVSKKHVILSQGEVESGYVTSYVLCGEGLMRVTEPSGMWVAYASGSEVRTFRNPCSTEEVVKACLYNERSSLDVNRIRANLDRIAQEVSREA